jgi:hypothetical protein
MKGRVTKSEARGFRARWEMVNRAEREELRTTPMEQKAKQLAALMESAEALGWQESLMSDEAEVRERWNALRRSQWK